MTQQHKPSNPWLASRTRTGAEYDAPYLEKAQAGHDVHGEANVVEKLLRERYTSAERQPPFAVLDAGCGTGRIGIELARRGVELVGIDLDAVMLQQAQKKAPHIPWILGDLATTAVSQKFDLIVMAGNVMIFVTPGSETAVLQNMAAHLKPGGLLLAAFSLAPRDWTRLNGDSYEKMAQAVGLTTLNRWSSWNLDEWHAEATYIVSLHQL